METAPANAAERLIPDESSRSKLRETIAKAPDFSSANPIKVMIVDDHPVVREGLRTILDVPDIDVVAEARTGTEACELVPKVEPDAILMDLQMPGMDGLEATAIIKKAAPRVSVVVMTSHESRELLRRAIQVGAAGYILKEISREIVIEAIRVTRAGGSLVEPRLLAELLHEVRATERDRIAKTGLRALSPREREVLALLVEGLSNKEIAQRINWSVGTVKNALQRIIEKLGVSDRTQAAVFAVRAGLPLPGTAAN